MINKQKQEIVRAEAKALYAELAAKKDLEGNGAADLDEELERKKRIASAIKGIIKTDDDEKRKLAEKKVD